MLLPATCPICGCEGIAPCAGCQAQLRRSGPVPRPPGLDAMAAAYAYDEARDLVVALKYRNARRIVPWATAELTALVDGPVELVTWPPTTAGRRATRGFDQAERLARGVARRLRVPCRRLLSRNGGTAQTGRTRSERLVGPTFAVRRRVQGRVLLVDDVVTTGATVSAAARALRSAGADEVRGVVLAHTRAIVVRDRFTAA